MKLFSLSPDVIVFRGDFRWSIVLALFISIGFLISTPLYASHEKASKKSSHVPISFSPHDAALYQIYSGDIQLTGDLLVFQPPGEIFIPLRALCDALKLHVNVDVLNKKANLTSSGPEEHFQLDVSSSTVTQSGRKSHYDARLVVSMPDDLYVERSLIAAWFGLSIDNNRFWGKITISGKTPAVINRQDVHIVDDSFKNSIEPIGGDHPKATSEEIFTQGNGYVKSVEDVTLGSYGIEGVSKGGASEQPHFGDEDALLCTVDLNKISLSGAFLTYMYGNSLFLPLGEFSRLLEFGIHVDVKAGTASGTAARPTQPFLLDIASGSVRVSGYALRYDAAKVVIMPDDIYVESGLVAEWFSMHINANRFSAAIEIKPFRPIPLQERIAREQGGSNTWGYGVYKDSGYPRRYFPYHLLDGASIDITLSSSYVSHPEHPSTPVASTYNSCITGDLLWMNAAVDISGQISGGSPSQGPIENGNIKLERSDPDGGLLGPLAATNFAVGDLSASSLPLIGAASSGPGLVVSSYPVQQNQLFDLVTLHGYLAPGWDVQLFRNGSLLDYRPSTPEERYEFIDIPLHYGLNELELVFNGPQGDGKRETHLYRVGTNMMEPGHWAYQAAISVPSRQSVFKERQGIVLSDPGVMATWRSTYGISKWLTMSQYLASSRMDGARHNYFGSGLSGYLSGLQIDTDLAFDSGRSVGARQAGFMTEIAGLSLSGRYSDLDRAWVNTSGQTGYTKRIEGRLGGLRVPFFRSSSTYSVGYGKSLYTGGQGSELWDITGYLSSYGIQHTHHLYMNRQLSGQEAMSSTYGASSFTWLGQRLSLSGNFQYQFIPESMLSSFNVTDRLEITDDMLLSNSYSYDFQSHSWRTGLTLSRLEPFGAISFSGTYSKSGEWRAGFDFAMNFSRDPRLGEWHNNGTRMSQAGGVSALAYIDKNMNRQRDEGEACISDAGFFVNTHNHPGRTDSSGTAFLQNLQANVPNDITLAAATLTDFSWIPADRGYRVVPRPGMPGMLDFPVWVTGEISGIVYRDNGESKQYASGILVEVLDMDGKQLSKTITEYDGFYVISKLPVGPIRVRVSPEQAARLEVEGETISIEIPSNGGNIDNVYLIIRNKTVAEDVSSYR